MIVKRNVFVKGGSVQVIFLAIAVALSLIIGAAVLFKSNQGKGSFPAGKSSKVNTSSSGNLANGKSSKGLYALVFGSGKGVDDQVLKLDYVSGVVIHIGWADLEPTEKHYDFSLIDAQLKRAKDNNKSVALTVIAGRQAPSWLCSAGAKCFSYIKNGQSRTGETLTAQVPWDEVMLSHYKDLINELGKRYDKDSSVMRINVGGPTQSTAEMILQQAPKDMSLWRSLGYSEEKIVNAWKEAIDILNGAFPNTEMVLKLNPLPADSLNGNLTVDPLKTIADYGKSVAGKRFILEQDSLGTTIPSCGVDWRGSNDPLCQTYQLMLDSTLNLGVQPGEHKICGPKEKAGNSSESCDAADDYTTVLKRALSLNVKYIEVNVSRFGQNNLQSQLQGASNTLLGK